MNETVERASMLVVEDSPAYQELYRLLARSRTAAVVNGWPSSQMMSAFEPLMRLSRRLRSATVRLRGKPQTPRKARRTKGEGSAPKGTFTDRHDYRWVQNAVGAEMPLEILVWRSVSVRFLRTLIHPRLGGRYWLRLLYWLEERYPHYFGEVGQYPLIIIQKE